MRHNHLSISTRGAADDTKQTADQIIAFSTCLPLQENNRGNHHPFSTRRVAESSKQTADQIMAFSTCLPVQETKSSGGIKYRSELAASVGARNRPQIRSWLSRHAFPYRRPRVQEESNMDLNWLHWCQLVTGRRSV